MSNLFTKQTAKDAAARLNGSHVEPDTGRGKRTAKVGKHVTNGQTRHVVHVNTADGLDVARTYSSPTDPAIPLGD